MENWGRRTQHEFMTLEAKILVSNHPITMLFLSFRSNVILMIRVMHVILLI